MEQKKNSESILIKVKKRSKSQRDHAYSYVDLSNLPLIDVYDNIIKKCQEKTKKVEDYFYILYVIKKKKENSSDINEFPIYNEEDWKDFISLNIYNMYLESSPKQLKIEFFVVNLTKNSQNFLSNAYDKKFQSIVKDVPNETFISILKDFINTENLMEKCILFLEHKLIKIKNYNQEELQKKLQNNFIQLQNYYKLQYNKKKISEIINLKLEDLSNQIKIFKDLENSIIDLKKNIDLKIEPEFEGQIFKTMINNETKDINFDNIGLPSFVKMFSEKGDFHNTLIKETMDLQNENMRGTYMSTVIDQV